MRFLTLRRRALLTLQTSSGGLSGRTAALMVRRDEGVSTVSVLRKLAAADPLRKAPTHFFHYKHLCDGKVEQELWILEKDMPDADGEHFICPACRMMALSVATVPQQQSEILIGGISWPP